MQTTPASPEGPAARRSLWPRIAAVVALLAPVVMAVVAAVALAGDVAIAVLAVALVLVASAAIWVALTRRGPQRAAGAVLAALTGIGLVVVLATHWQGVLVLIALLLLLAVFGLAARYALGWTGEAAVEGAAAVVPVGAAGSAVLIINLKSGGGKAERFDLVAQARRRGIEPIVLQPGDDLLELAESAIARGAQVVGMAGGDGSQALVATVAAGRDVAHVCVPAGTRNHFALDLGLDRDDVVGALDAFTDGVERRIDLARVNDRVFVNNASLGVYAKVVQSDAYRDAKLETWTSWLGTAILGTLHTFFPSLTQTQLRYPRLQRPTYVLWLLGIVGLAAGAAFDRAGVLATGWIALLLAATLLAVNLLASLLAIRVLVLALRAVGPTA